MTYSTLDDTATPTSEQRTSWANWLREYGAEQFFDAFVQSAQNAQSECVYCGERIYLDIVEGGGVPDRRTDDGDYGCSSAPETCYFEDMIPGKCVRRVGPGHPEHTDGCGSHKARGHA